MAEVERLSARVLAELDEASFDKAEERANKTARNRKTKLTPEVDKEAAAKSEETIDHIARERKIKLDFDEDSKVIDLLGGKDKKIEIISEDLEDQVSKVHIEVDKSDEAEARIVLADVAQSRDSPIHPEVDKTDAVEAEAALDLLARDRKAEINIDKDSDLLSAVLPGGDSGIIGEAIESAIPAMEKLVEVGAEVAETIGEGVKSGMEVATEATESLGKAATGVGETLVETGKSAQEGGQTAAAGGKGFMALSFSLGAAISEGASLITTFITMSVMASLALVAIGLLGPAIVVLGSAVIGLVAALGPLVGLLGLLPGLILGVVAAGGVLLLIFQDVMKAGMEMFQSQQQQEQNMIKLADAERALASAEIGLARATRDYANARRDAAEAIEDAHFAATAAQLGEERAVIGLERAYKRLTDVQNEMAGKTTEITKVTDDFTGKQFEVARVTMDAAELAEQLRDARLGVREAELALAQARDRNEDAQRTQAEMDEKGIDNSDILIDRTQRLADAEANRAAAVRALSDAQGALVGHGQAYKQLNPEAQKFVDTLGELFKLVKPLKDALEAAIFPALTEGLKNFQPFLEAITPGLVALAGAFGEIFKAVANVFSEPRFQAQFATFLEQGAEFMERLGPIAASLMRAFMNITIAAAPLVEEIFSGIEDGVNSFEKWTEDSDQLGEGFKLTGETLKTILEITGNLFKGIMGVMKAALPFGTWILDEISKWATEFSEKANSPEGQKTMSEFFESMKEPLSALMRLTGGLFETFVKVFSDPRALDQLTRFAETMLVDVLPALTVIIDDLYESGLIDTFTETITALSDMIQTLHKTGVLDIIMQTFKGAFIFAQLISKEVEVWALGFKFFAGLWEGLINGIIWVINHLKIDTGIPGIGKIDLVPGEIKPIHIDIGTGAVTGGEQTGGSAAEFTAGAIGGVVEKVPGVGGLARGNPSGVTVTPRPQEATGPAVGNIAQKPNVTINNTFMERQDPELLSRTLAWKIAV